MALITNTEISPNAGILGTQIADKTIQLRNIGPDIIGVAASGSITVNATSVGGTYTNSVAHNLGFPPLATVSVSRPDNSTAYFGCTYFEFSSATNFRRLIYWTDDTNINFEVDLGSGAGAGTVGIYTFKYYLLLESAAS